MNPLLVVVTVTLLLSHEIKGIDEDNNNDTDIDVHCTDLQENFFGSLLNSLSKTVSMDKVEFYLAVKGDKDGMKLNAYNLSAIETKSFNPSVNTYIIVHGYRSNYRSDWILELKDKLLEYRNINIIIVDWSSGSYSWNYINSVRHTTEVAKYIFKFLEAMQIAIQSNDDETNILWPNLYFIGHSLGAQISGQAARLLQRNKFFNLERITGLDPAQPCFQKENLEIKLDKSDAKFVDIIHTQAGGFGVQEPIGHADFYVNGGVLQPSCTKSIFTTSIQKKMCSHMSGCSYLIESIVSSNNTECKFWAYKWNSTYDNALEICDAVKNGKPYENCPEMGIDAVNNQQNGIFLVLTTKHKPQCKWKNNDTKKVLKALKELKKRKATTS